MAARAAMAKVGKWLGGATLATAALVAMPGVAAADAYPPSADPPLASGLYFYTEEGTCTYGDDGILTGGVDPLIFGMRAGTTDTQTTDTQVKVTIRADTGPTTGATGSVVLYTDTYDLQLSDDKEWLTGYTVGKWAYERGKIDLDTVTATLVGVQSGQTASPLKLSCPLNAADYEPYWEDRGSDGADATKANTGDITNNTSTTTTTGTVKPATLPNTGVSGWGLGALGCTLVGSGGLLMTLSKRRRGAGVI